MRTPGEIRTVTGIEGRNLLLVKFYAACFRLAARICAGDLYSGGSKDCLQIPHAPHRSLRQSANRFPQVHARRAAKHDPTFQRLAVEKFFLIQGELGFFKIEYLCHVGGELAKAVMMSNF